MDNIMQHIDESGAFADSFKEQIGLYAGDEFKGSKVFDDVPDVATLIKNYAHTKTAYGKKLDNVIQLPNDASSDEDKAAAITAAQDFLGAPKEAKDYEFPRVDGLDYSEEREKLFREFFMTNRVPVDFAKSLVETFNKMQVDMVNAQLDTEKK